MTAVSTAAPTPQRDPRALVLVPAPPAEASSWRRRFSRRVLAADVLVVLGAVSLAAGLRSTAEARSAEARSADLVVAGVLGALWVCSVLLAQRRLAHRIGAGADEFRRLLSATVATFGLASVASVLTHVDLPRVHVLIALPVGLGGMLAAHALSRGHLARERRAGRALSRVIVVGSAGDVTHIVTQIDRRRGRVEYDVVGVALSTGGERTLLADPRRSITVRGRSIPVVGAIDTIAQAVVEQRADAVVVAGQVDGGDAYLRRLCWALEPFAVELVLAPGLSSVAGPRIHWRPVDGLPLMRVEPPRYSGPRHALKRVLDVSVSALALLVLSPLLAVLAVMIRRDSTGPALFRQQRVGRAGHLFTMLKFRSMSIDAESRLAELSAANEGSGLLFKLRDDPRVTPLGRVLRRYSLDELPQFWNVLRGSMSLVGPRPPLLSEVERYDDVVNRRLYIKPGITGLWQTGGRSELDWEDGIRLDLYYVENWSLAGDLLILWRTLRVMLRPVGAY
ncbi:sugar transferase [Rathayibacter festucae]|uniref:sugar transferase n=1 Tax=Rathayibacter TaxID=33886 RepID=UPI000F462AEE|nr:MULTISPECIES: sugar transferase [Rathayibacter]MCJ1700631.1 sugar transferase [Rathayibacter festucae]ROQ05339.1 Undecaprenyl-phosphate galactose phosphotransferase WbaP/exopolysaccharide biosynthesis polyprenyl glycosylphosphotransferase [Rathayibacter sp. PhB93]TCL83878.1 Undecaprenyl-phosphate galactose phosphotransferase WbaP/exopolysaccharide biosynthesis polyprenyl glycosylphosphotransferase [Rathayibacter sp. PhB192]TCM29471.1 Undecaprenyl-phosphate galactose phosphotransferase WbaP/e